MVDTYSKNDFGLNLYMATWTLIFVYVDVYNIVRILGVFNNFFWTYGSGNAAWYERISELY